MIFLALDYGERRIGLAISDDDARLALPLQTLTRGTNDARGDIQKVLDWMAARGATALVLGIPGGSDASDAMAGRARRFAAQLLDAARLRGLEITLFEADERFSSAQAHAQSRAAQRETQRTPQRMARNTAGSMTGASARISREESGGGSIDARAAAVFLQTFLDFRRAQNAENPAPNPDLDAL